MRRICTGNLEGQSGLRRGELSPVLEGCGDTVGIGNHFGHGISRGLALGKHRLATGWVPPHQDNWGVDHLGAKAAVGDG